MSFYLPRARPAMISVQFCRDRDIDDDTTPTPRSPVRYATLVKILVLYCSTLINAPTLASGHERH